MQVELPDTLAHDPLAREAAAVIGRCVHCGFCNATCPTYQLRGDELDGPRGRLYLMKQLLEGKPAGEITRLHLDRCLTCRACETTCPSGVEYGRAIEASRELLELRLPRPAMGRWRRVLLRMFLGSRAFSPALAIGRVLRPWLPLALRRRIPRRTAAGLWPVVTHARKVLVPGGCVQPALFPRTDAALARILARLGVSVIAVAGCCGSLRQHLDDPAGALAGVRANVDAWWPHVERGIESIMMTASACGLQVKDYGRLLGDDPAYAGRAARIAALARDPAEYLGGFSAELHRLCALQHAHVVFHAPCTLQHGQRLGGSVESLLARLGAKPLPVADAQLCCGSAGAYSILQSAISSQLRDRKLRALTASRPTEILSANVGCIAHLAAGTDLPVRHWLEWLDEVMTRPGVPSSTSPSSTTKRPLTST